MSFFSRFKNPARPNQGDAMETRPAPLDSMSSDEDGIEQFRVTSPREIGTILKHCWMARHCSTSTPSAAWS
jgi:hypothetical protein